MRLVLDHRGGTRPGVSVFLREGHRVFCTYPARACGADPLTGTCAYPGLTPLGGQRYVAGFPHHDTYDTGS